MAPPKFSDLGKTAKDLFSKGFEHGNTKLEVKSKTKNLESTVKGALSNNSKGIKASAEMTWCSNDKGVTYKNVFHSNSNIDTEITKHGAEKTFGKTVFKGSLNQKTGSYTPQDITQTFFGSQYHMNIKTTCAKSPILSLDAVYNHNNINLGFDLGYDVSTGNLTKNTLGLSIAQDNTSVTAVSGLKNDLNIHIHKNMDCGSLLGFNVAYKGDVSLGLAGKCKNDIGTTNFKIDQTGNLTTSLVTKLSSSCEATVTAHANLTNLTSSGPVLGALFKFNM